MSKQFRMVALLAAALALSGCASAVSRVPAGPLKVSGARVTLGRDWADVTKLLPNRPKKVLLLSIDGPLLNRLYLSGALSKGDYIVRPAAKERPTPVVREGMSATERIEFVTDSVAAMDYQRVESARPRPATYAGHPAVRFDIDARTGDGLEVSGTALISEIAGKTYVIIYLAPTEHYYATGLPEVEQVMASARPG
jgi:hypothetical protein